MDAKRAAPAGAPLGDQLATVTSQRWYWWLVGISVIGGLEVAQFVATNTGMFSSAPGRAAGSVLGVILWAALAGLAGVAATGRRSRSLAQATLVVAGLVAVGSLGLTVIHAAAHVGGLRPALGGVLSLLALGFAIMAVRN
ncbi:MAG: hypothetical protein WA751_02225 [Candidatus Dormiibacterota bacterium]